MFHDDTTPIVSTRHRYSANIHVTRFVLILLYGLYD